MLISEQESKEKAFQSHLRNSPYAIDWLVYADFLEENHIQPLASFARLMADLVRGQAIAIPETMWVQIYQVVKRCQEIPFHRDFLLSSFDPYYLLRHRCFTDRNFYLNFRNLFLEKLDHLRTKLDIHRVSQNFSFAEHQLLYEITSSILSKWRLTRSVGEERNFFPDELDRLGLTSSSLILKEKKIFVLWAAIERDIRSLLENKERLGLKEDVLSLIGYFTHGPVEI